MTRIVKEYDERRSEILDTAQRLFYSKGYEQTAVQEIIKEIGVAKGTFYHYFDSKLMLLDAIVARMLAQTVAAIAPIVEDNNLTAVAKLEQFFLRAEDHNSQEKAFYLAIMQRWFQDDNAIFRHKLKAASLAATRPLLAQIIEQGVREGSFDTAQPEEVSEMIITLSHALGETTAVMLINAADDNDLVDALERKVAAHEHAVERLLGAPPGRLHLFDRSEWQQWLGQAHAQ